MGTLHPRDHDRPGRDDGLEIDLRRLRRQCRQRAKLLQGRLARGVMDRVCRQGDWLFPGPKQMKLSCSCPDGAYMCKHVAAALYGVGTRLDTQPELLFVLRGGDPRDMIAGAGAQLASPTRAAAKGKALVDDDMAALFGLDMVETNRAEASEPAPVAKPAPAAVAAAKVVKPSVVPPTGAKGLNLAASYVGDLSEALAEHYRNGSIRGIDAYSDRALARVWMAERFSWWMTTLLHTFNDRSSFDQNIQMAELDYLLSSRAASTALAENYVGRPL